MISSVTSPSLSGWFLSFSSFSSILFVFLYMSIRASCWEGHILSLVLHSLRKGPGLATRRLHITLSHSILSLIYGKLPGKLATYTERDL
jgi:hypothetical protein